MSVRRYEDHCPGCRPVLVDENDRPLPNGHPAMRAVLKAWETVPREERHALHNVCCQNSEDPRDLELAERVRQHLEAAVKSLPGRGRPLN